MEKKKNLDKKCWRRKSTNLPVKGWVSIDRSMVTALLRTTPRQVPRSSTDDLAPAHHTYRVCTRNRGRKVYTVPWCSKSKRPRRRKAPQRGTKQLKLPIDVQGTINIVAVARRDSDLEAFSRNPTDGSFAPLATRPRTCTKCPNLRFLSYWAGLLSQRQSISRVKLTCLRTV